MGARAGALLAEQGDRGEERLRGRPSGLTPDAKRKIINALRMTMTVDDAAILGGIHPRTLYRWLERGKRGTRGEYVEFRHEVELAITEGKSVLVGRVFAGSRLRPDLALKHLGRRWPSEWGPKAMLAVTQQDTADADAVRERIAARLDAIEQRQKMAAQLAVNQPGLRQIADSLGGEDSQ